MSFDTRILLGFGGLWIQEFCESQREKLSFCIKQNIFWTQNLFSLSQNLKEDPQRSGDVMNHREPWGGLRVIPEQFMGSNLIRSGDVLVSLLLKKLLGGWSLVFCFHNQKHWAGSVEPWEFYFHLEVKDLRLTGERFVQTSYGFIFLNCPPN